MNTRIARLTAAMNEQHLDAVVVVPGANLRYLTGLEFHRGTGDRLTMALFPADGSPPCLVVPALEMSRVRGSTGDTLRSFPWNDAEGHAEALRRAVEEVFPGQRHQADPPVPGIEEMVMRVSELRALERCFSHPLRTADASPLLAKLRMVKDAAELAAMAEAVRIIETALRATIAHIRPGLTERQLSAIWSNEIRAAGAEGESFENIVASGPNSANPHHTSGDRPIQVGDLVLLDGGAMYHGYASDITRVVALGEPGPMARQIYDLVLRANAAGRAAVRPGVTGEQVDQASRQVIADGGYGKQFLHRTGHGLGMECHEPPSIVAGNHEPLAVGTTFTIEPGIYLEGIGGVRIEDDVVVTDEGGRSLTSFGRELLVLPVPHA
ncbi:MAG: aminopeptidase P family protein [Chloroflexaceae bacterium]|nr:aminopeptidase P family protein [Chloroflexaceae bacterium]